ncbi:MULTISPECIES: hypothetical protein [Acinetobacter]|jgi:hypothetical protein|uniref:DdrR n=2 Tax=Acinetobacter beijerinckii TaxID=262668 RepID=N9E0I3_9GAMM|nr:MULTISPECIES: hypothetical protein [Acinetobacter]MBC9228244.1 hypothetical protein [Acinetobacter baumannii]ENW03792.1 hypothetical protein F933_02762 [Acinetobacter beijerinckii CIP 110307]ENW03968.1 hypothetical protein F934_02004 [Acinetobacter beijerinckii ANC 3835]MDF2417167.1 hypothetical protein [Acinetobacter beijerinckii]UTO20823.1 hypothetical protein NGC85_07025 [Acinetobacter sp. Z1]
MNNQRDAILGYADEQHAYFIRLIENNTVLGNCYGLFCESPDSEAAESIMTTLFLKKSFWLNGSEFQHIVQGLQPL